MIIYFTGTGNSKLVAEKLQEKINDELVSLNEILKEEKKWIFKSEKPFVIVSPIYAWRLPKVIERVLKEAKFIGSKEIYVVVTMGANSGNADKYCEKIITKRNLEFMGFRGVEMPDNYMVFDVMMSEADAIVKIEKSLNEVTKIADIINENKILVKDDSTSLSSLKSGFVNWAFKKFQANSRSFTILDKCIECGKCIKVCPMNNIEMKDEKPVFSDKCIFCLSCINRCPVGAIEYHGKTEKNGQYVCPDYDKINS